jgi:hypothetical protein
MAADEVVFWAIVGALFSANALASVLVIRSRYYLWPQKLMQCAVVWAIPLLGPIAIWAFLRNQEQADIFDTRAYPEPSEKMVAAEIQNTINDNVGSGAGGAEGGASD